MVLLLAPSMQLLDNSQQDFKVCWVVESFLPFVDLLFVLPTAH